MNDDIDHHSPVVCGLCVVCRTTFADRKRCLGVASLTDLTTPWHPGVKGGRSGRPEGTRSALEAGCQACKALS